MSGLAECNCLITGASRGLGAEIARLFWGAGANLLLVARRQAALDKVVDGLPKRPDQRVETLTVDLVAPSSPEIVVSRARELFDGLDVLVNNAAAQGPVGASWENDWAAWLATFQINLLAPLALCRLVIPWMAERHCGKIVNLSGGGATNPRPGFSAYGSSKAALVRFSETLAVEARELGIQVNCIAPGAMATAMQESIVEAGPSLAGQREYDVALRTLREGSPALAKAAALCLFLASPDSDGLTGKLVSAVWDPWECLPQHLEELDGSDIYTLRRIVPRDRGLDWGRGLDGTSMGLTECASVPRVGS